MSLAAALERFPFIKNGLNFIQSKLDFTDWIGYPLFHTKQGLGRVALIGTILGMLWGIHFVGFLILSWNFLYIETITSTLYPRLLFAWQWCIYFMSLCTFHLLEFFTTAIYNPSVATANSFLVNHSNAYTLAALVSWIEFTLRCCLLPTYNSIYLSWLGIIMVILSQVIRSLAMATCGESFNHLIQRSKKSNHILITHGIYKYIRHPSYCGFHFWSIGMQLILTNYMSLLLCATASWMFFRSRIPFEEESLLQFFPEEYPRYAQQTHVGIPFIPTLIPKGGSLSNIYNNNESANNNNSGPPSQYRETINMPNNPTTTDNEKDKTN